MMTVEPDEKEIWLTVHEVAKVCKKSLRQVQYYAAAKPGERALLQASGGRPSVVRLDHFKKFLRRKFPTRPEFTIAELDALRGPQKPTMIWCRSLHLDHSHLVRPDGTTACSGASNGVKLPYGAAWIPCEAGDYGRKCTRCMGHASG